MKMKATLPSGTRDFGPETMQRRIYLIDLIKNIFRQYGFLQIETPAMEHLTTLKGKYGEEGEQLIFKILDSGDFLKEVDWATSGNNAKELGKVISHKGLRYDLTVPLARYITQHRDEITFPFKRFQVQPVWRADRPQKGRYREFYQCDADIVGGDSLLYEVEMLTMLQKVFTQLGIDNFIIALNHRLIFKAVAEKLGLISKEGRISIILDKLEKIGWEKVAFLLREENISAEAIEELDRILRSPIKDGRAWLLFLRDALGGSDAGQKAIKELEDILNYMVAGGHSIDNIAITPTLARGMGYYTGAIFEVKIENAPRLGSLAAGGRYDELSTVFGMQALPSVGLSFGVERIYELLLEKHLFPTICLHTTELLLVPLSESQEAIALSSLSQVRSRGLSAELYPPHKRLKKALSYANAKQILWVGIIGEEEAPYTCTLKNMQTGKQVICNFDDLVKFVKVS